MSPDPFEQALASESRQLFSQTHGEGRRYAIGSAYDEPHGYLELFPKNGVVRYQGEGVSFASQFPDHPDIEADRLTFSSESEHERRSMTITSRGEITLFVSPRPTPETIDADPTENHSGDVNKMPTAIAKPIEPSTETISNTKTESERKDRVEMTGRVGKTPELRETAKGVPITKFPLAEHPDGKEGETVWHTIVSFKELAKKVSETVKKGDQVKVIGYRSEREYNGKTTTEINAVVVKPPKASESKVDD